MLTAGQTLWWVGTHRHNAGPHEVTVRKVGRKWAEIDGGERIDINTLRADGGKYVSPGQCWSSKAAWEAEVARQEAWRNLCNRIGNIWHAPPGIDVDRIHRAALALGLEVE